jgi:uncharacterized RDD family membrane protein YckC
VKKHSETRSLPHASELPTESGPTGTLPTTLHPGQQFGGYRIVRLLGQGGMGWVFEAEDQQTGRRIAVKLMNRALTSSRDRMRFLREGRLAALVNHPNSVYVFGTEEIDGVPVITMELSGEGTLQDQVRASGPLEPRAAVDAVLQVIDGLEAAAERGVLHRDVKPSNCFVGERGIVKVGDYGLSVSTVSDETTLTQTGTVLGTPVFSSPEQLRGQTLDVRSDIYSVGATLFYLLTGRPPFVEKGFVNLLAAVLERDPPAPGSVREGIPTGLSRIVTRCLSRRQEARYSTYDELRQALQPFGSKAAMPPAPIGRRFGAYMIDYLPALLLGYLAGIFAAATKSEPEFYTLNIWSQLGAQLVWLVYFSIGEGRWGMSVGKLLLGLRVVGPGQGTPGYWRAAGRYLILTFVPSIPNYVFFTLAAIRFGSWNPSIPVEQSPGAIILPELLEMVILLLLFVTIRRRNGFAAVYELITGTRVVKRARIQSRLSTASVAHPAEKASASGGNEAIGPYTVTGKFAENATGEILTAWDPKLGRPVWVQRLASGQSHFSEARRAVTRLTRLRWLGGRAGTDAPGWDAFAAVEGCSIMTAMAKPRPWSEIRHWIADLASEVHLAATDGTLPERLSLDRLWCDTRGQLVWLDFAANAADGSPAKRDGPDIDPTDMGEVQSFLADLITRASHDKMPLPLGAARFRAALSARRFSRSEEPLQAAQVLLSERAVTTRSQRLGLMACSAAALILVTAPAWLSALQMSWQAPNYPEETRLVRHLIELLALRQEQPTPGPAVSVTTLERYIAGEYGDRFRSEEYPWPSEMNVPSALTALARAVAIKHPQVEPAELASLRAELAPYLEIREEDAARYDTIFFWGPLGMHQAMRILWPTSLVSLLFSFLLRGGLWWGMFGIGLVTCRGPAPRWRALVRAIVVWSPLLFWLPYWQLQSQFLGHFMYAANRLAIGSVGLALVLAGVVWPVWRPERGISDLVAGTYLVPK